MLISTGRRGGLCPISFHTRLCSPPVLASMGDNAYAIEAAKKMAEAMEAAKGMVDEGESCMLHQPVAFRADRCACFQTASR